jgi:hypothetical protein
VKGDYERSEIIKQAFEQNLVPKLNQEDLINLVGLVEGDSQKYEIIKQAFEKNLVPELNQEDLINLVGLVKGNRYRSEIIKQSFEQNLVPELNQEGLINLVGLVEDEKQKLILVKDNYYRSEIIKQAFEQNLVPKLNQEDLINLVGLVEDEKQKLIIFIKALNKGLTLESNLDLSLFGLQGDDQQRSEAIKQAFEKNLVPELNQEDLINLVGLVEDKTKYPPSVSQTPAEHELPTAQDRVPSQRPSGDNMLVTYCEQLGRFFGISNPFRG